MNRHSSLHTISFTCLHDRVLQELSLGHQAPSGSAQQASSVGASDSVKYGNLYALCHIPHLPSCNQLLGEKSASS